MKKKLTFFQMMYCWMFVYVSKIKHRRILPADSSCNILSLLRGINILIICRFINYLFMFTGEDKKVFLFIQYGLAICIFILDNIIFFHRRDVILSTFIDYPEKEKQKGKVKFWIYIAATIMLLGAIGYFNEIVKEPLLPI